MTRVSEGASFPCPWLFSIPREYRSQEPRAWHFARHKTVLDREGLVPEIH